MRLLFPLFPCFPAVRAAEAVPGVPTGVPSLPAAAHMLPHLRGKLVLLSAGSILRVYSFFLFFDAYCFDFEN